jgi:tRNA dimethylallyltransferase
VGKTEIALKAAILCGGEIVGADAFQIYRGLDLLSAKPSREDQDRVPHHLVGTVPLSQPFDVAQYLEAATRSVAEIAARGKVAVIAGGTGLYMRALTHGLSDLPDADPAIRAELEAQSLEELQARYIALDHVGAETIDLKNRRRLVRAIEVCLLTGRPFSDFRDTWNKAPAEPITGFFLTRDRDDLYERTDRRVVEMFRDGVVEEVRSVAEIGMTAGQAIGFKEIQDYVAGKMSERKCIEKVQQATRHYAKRQLTWFRRETMFQEVNLSLHTDLESIVGMIAHAAGAAVAAPDV